LAGNNDMIVAIPMSEESALWVSNQLIEHPRDG